MKHIKKIFKKHWEYYSKKQATDIAQITGLTKHISDEYQGRVIYELLQNAFDPAEKIVKVDIKTIEKKDYLVVSNDNDERKFGFKEFNYAETLKPDEDDNFHALCSIATSSKTVDKNIGNKGVGFKSVFSLSNEVYIISKQSENEIITFKLYGQIGEAEFKNIQKNIQKYIQIDFIKKGTVIPGFYYPLLLEGDTYNSLLEDKLVTAIAIPIDSKLEYVRKLIEDVKKYHFEFIKEKYNQKNELKIYIDSKDEFEQNKIKIFSEKKFAIICKKDEESFLYNFMPSLVKSPFKCMDINGEFQTSVNREYINFDTKSEIGKKNLSILKKAMNYHLGKLSNLCEIDEYKDIFWKLLQINNEGLKDIIKKTILERYDNWDKFANYLVELAKKYFKQANLSIKNFDDFWKVVFYYIHIFAGVQGKDTGPYREKLKSFIDKLESISVIYSLNNNHMSFKDNIFFKDEENNNIVLPNFLNINIVAYNFLGYFWLFKKIDKLKYFSTYEEILKHFRQIPKDGTFSKDGKINNTFSEGQQLEVLDSLYSIYRSKQENNHKEYLSTHRYSKYLSRDLRDKANIENNAYFAIATIFLKVKDIKKYKPAQILRKTDIDLSFHGKLKDDGFLNFLGVSLDANYLFCDATTYNNFKDGYDFIPAIISDDNNKLKSEEIIPNIIIVEENKKKIYSPALVNENYNFLDTIKKGDIKVELDNLKVKQYDYFPREYFEKLLERMEQYKEANAVIRLYNRIFISYYAIKAKDFIYLTIQNNVLSFQKENDFKIAKTKEEFELLKNSDLKLLCYYGGEKRLANDLKLQILELTYSVEVNKEQEDTHKVGTNLKTLMPNMLYNISQLDDFESKIDFLDNSQEKIDKLKKDFNKIKFHFTTSIKKLIKKDEQSIFTIENLDVVYDNEKKFIYYKNDENYEELAKVISEVFFKSNKAISQVIENTYLKKESLQVNSEITDIKKIWDNEEYEKNYQKFLSSLFEKDKEMLRKAEDDNRWFEYSQNHISVLIERVPDLKKFSTLVQDKSEEFGIDIKIIIDIPDNTKIMQKLSSLQNLNDTDKETIYNFKFRINQIVESEYEDILKNNGLITINDLDENSKALANLKKENEKKDKLKKIKETLTSFEDYSTFNFDAKLDNAKSNTKEDNIHKSIVIREMSNGTKEIDLKKIGDNGEYIVLGYYIDKFINNSFDKKVSLKLVHEKLKEEVPEKEHETLQTYYNKCLDNLNKKTLRESLIDLFFVTLHYPYASFDIIAVDDSGKPLLVEVKTTKSINNNSFRISSGEIKKAKSSDNYTIVRVTPKKIIFLGNPIKKIKEKLTKISGDNFSIIPNGYIFKFISEEIQ